MESSVLFGSLVEVNRQATKAWYEAAAPWNCECDGCQNYLAVAKKGQLPVPVVEALHQLQIPPEKATYVCHMYSQNSLHLYQFCYRVAGRILSASASDGSAQDWGEGRCGHDDYPYGAPGFPEPHFDMIFYANLPWAADFEG